MRARITASIDWNGPAVAKAARKARRTWLFRAGAYVRTVARRLLGKRSKKASPVGSPPTAHNAALKNFTLFAVDPEAGNVVIGPQGIHGSQAPAALEYGGPSLMLARPARVDRKGHRRAAEPAKRITIGPRPYMRPSLDQSASKLDDLWAGAVK